MTPLATDLASLAAGVEWPDAEAALEARAAEQAHAAGHPSSGRLAELVEWLAGAQGRYPPLVPSRPRCVVVGDVSPAVAALADSLDVGIRGVPIPDDLDVAGALALGTSVADDEAESGTDLLVVADPDTATAAAVVVSLVTGAEPVALLPRGAAAVDTSAWIALARLVRDTRREVAAQRGSTDDLLARLAHPRLAVTAGVVLGAVARRTPVVLDGTATVVAALLGQDAQARAGRWWRVADTSPLPVHTRAVAELVQRPLLDLGTSAGDGTAGLLTVPLVRAAAGLAAGAAS